MFKKVIKINKPVAENATTATTATVKISENVCQKCGKPATIISAKGRRFCCLACQTNFGD